MRRQELGDAVDAFRFPPEGSPSMADYGNHGAGILDDAVTALAVGAEKRRAGTCFRERLG